MARSLAKSEASRKKMTAAASGAFLEHGLGGIGVDGLAKAAEFTSGAFYFHFKNKLEAFIAGFEANLDGLLATIGQLQKDHGAEWVAQFAAFYLGYKRTCKLKNACAVPVLSSEVERAGPGARKAYERKVRAVFALLADGLAPAGGASSREQAIALMAILAGGALLSRAVQDAALSEEISAAVQRTARLHSAQM